MNGVTVNDHLQRHSLRVWDWYSLLSYWYTIFVHNSNHPYSCFKNKCHDTMTGINLGRFFNTSLRELKYERRDGHRTHLLRVFVWHFLTLPDKSIVGSNLPIFTACRLFNKGSFQCCPLFAHVCRRTCMHSMADWLMTGCILRWLPSHYR